MQCRGELAGLRVEVDPSRRVHSTRPEQWLARVVGGADLRRRAVVTVGVLLVAAAGTLGTRVFAHHSFAATYLEDQTVTIEGALVQFLFRNPHSFVHVMVKESSGQVVRHVAEWGGTGQLGGQGITRETLKPGDYVIITGNPGRDPADHRVRMLALRRPKDGFGWGQRPGEVVD